ncbi:hypothetical protein EC913_112115 [Pseudomonas sp. LP_4_YM]|nr:hypothetical protein EC913_112115 [Pseudomonas sp. LP_4_YM]
MVPMHSLIKSCSKLSLMRMTLSAFGYLLPNVLRGQVVKMSMLLADVQRV